MTTNFFQRTYNPIDYGFRWTDDWYEMDDDAEKRAMKARNETARKLRKEGWTVKSSSSVQLISCGGIGSGRPHIELHVKCYMLDAWR